ncbi:MAG: MFS transporter [Chromatiales bacterium]|jgi:MFS family permease|nr:MFS transporter [Chromatiales bacterium]
MTQPGTPPTAAAKPSRSKGRVVGLFDNREFTYVWSAGALTGIVRWLQLLVMGIYTFQITESPLLVSMVPMLWMLPLALCGPFVGVVADRMNRKYLYCAALTLVTSVSAVMAILATIGTLQFVHIAIASVVSGLFWATDMPVRRRLLGDLSGGEIAAAMGLDSATSNATRMSGPFLGGVMLQWFDIAGVFMFSTVAFLMCFVLVGFTQSPRRENTEATPAFLKEFAAGIRYVRSDANLRLIFAVTIIFNVWGFPFTSMIPIIGSDVLKLNPLMVGLLSSTEGFGAFMGAIAIATNARPEYFLKIYVGGTISYLTLILYLSGLTFLAGGPMHSFYAVSLVLIGLGVSSACFAAMQGTLTYSSAPPEYRSRVLGVLTLCIGTGPIGFFNVGWMAELYDVPTALLIISVEGLVALSLLWLFSSEPSAEAV